MSAPYLNTEPRPQTWNEAAAVDLLQPVYRSLKAALPAVDEATGMADERIYEMVPRASDLLNDFGDLLVLVRDVIEANGGRVPS